MILTKTNWPNRRASSTDLFDIFEEMERAFRAPTEKAFTPSCEVTESAEHFLMSIDVPGFKKEDLKIEMNQNVLTISGERNREVKRTFARSFSLPTTVSAEKIEANYEDGVLSLYIPKTPVAKARTIEVQSNNGGFLERLLGNKKDVEAKASTSVPEAH